MPDLPIGSSGRLFDRYEGIGDTIVLWPKDRTSRLSKLVHLDVLQRA
ncbi:hypothetical protein ACVWWD_005644 [Mesorhizobium sp. URHB0026]